MTGATSKMAELVEQATKEREDRVQRAVANGGLPTEEDLARVEDLLQAAYDAVEQIVWRVEGICETDVGEDLPSTVSFEQIGFLATMSAAVAYEADELRKFAERLRAPIPHELPAIRAEQLARNGKEA